MLDWLKGFFELFERVLFGELNAHDPNPGLCPVPKI